MKFLMMALLVFVTCSCFHSRREHFCMADQLVTKNSKRIQSEGFEPLFSGGSYRNTIRLVSMGYTSKVHRLSSIEAARAFILNEVENFIQPFNEEKRIRMYLHNYPFTADNLELTFCFFDEKNKPLLPPNLAQVNCITGFVTYYAWDEKTKNLVRVHAEQFEDAVKRNNSHKKTGTQE